MELINKIRKSRKGFTLVEIIVVLVILAVLAAFMIPSMIGFVGETKKKAAIAEQREVYVAAQAVVTELFAKDETTAKTKLGMAAIVLPATDIEATNLKSDAAKDASGKDATPASQMKNYLSKDLDIEDVGTTTGSTWSIKVNADGQVTEVSYTRDDITLDPLKPGKELD